MSVSLHCIKIWSRWIWSMSSNNQSWPHAFMLLGKWWWSAWLVPSFHSKLTPTWFSQSSAATSRSNYSEGKFEINCPRANRLISLYTVLVGVMHLCWKLFFARYYCYCKVSSSLESCQFRRLKSIFYKFLFQNSQRPFRNSPPFGQL